MRNLRCIGRYKHNGKNIGYILRDNDGKEYKVKADKLKDVLGKGDMVIADLVLSSDGRLIPKGIIQDIDVQTAAKNIVNTRNKVINFEESKMTNLLVLLINTIGASGVPYEIVQCGWDKNIVKTEVYMIFSKKEKDNDYTFKIQIFRNGTVKGVTPYSVIEGATINDIARHIVEDIIKLYNEVGDAIYSLKDKYVDMYEYSKQLDNDFKTDKFANFEIITSGNNVVLLGFKDNSLQSISLPDCITVISDNAFDRLNKLNKVICKAYQRNMVRNSLNEARKNNVIVESVNKNME